MPWVALLRHGMSEWNERGLIQGRTDIALSVAGEATLRRVKPGGKFLRASWASSPLKRAAQTAAILAPGDAAIHAELIETNWGEFEGMRREQLAARIRELGLTPARGLDFTPPGGESARAVQHRLRKWFDRIARQKKPVVAVTHKGVIRAALSIACDWDMAADFTVKADWSLPHIFRVTGDGDAKLERLNCPWNEPPKD